MFLNQQGAHKCVGCGRFSVLHVTQIICNTSIMEQQRIASLYKLWFFSMSQKLCQISSHMQSFAFFVYFHSLFVGQCIEIARPQVTHSDNLSDVKGLDKQNFVSRALVQPLNIGIENNWVIIQTKALSLQESKYKRQRCNWSHLVYPKIRSDLVLQTVTG